MPMRQDCINATEAALGRPTTKGEQIGIEARIRNAMRQLGKADPAAWRGMTRAQQLQDAGIEAGHQLEMEAAKRKQRIGNAMAVQAYNLNYVRDQVVNNIDSDHLAALDRRLSPRYDDKSNDRSIESQSNGYFNAAIAEIASVFEALKPGFFSAISWEDPKISRQMRFALTGLKQYTDDQGNVIQIEPVFIAAADAFHKTTDAYRKMFNAAGGNIGKLENWDQPHAWSAKLVNKMGFRAEDMNPLESLPAGHAKRMAWEKSQMAQNKDAFVNDMVGTGQSQGVDGWLDRSKYIHEDGSRYDEAELREFMGEVWETIATDGWSKDQRITQNGVGGAGAPGIGSRPPGGAMIANRGAAHRAIHLKPEAVDAALGKYSEQSVAQAMTGHLRRMTRDLALIEGFGPNAALQFQTLKDQALAESIQAFPHRRGEFEKRAHSMQNLFDHLAGQEPLPVNNGLANASAAYRALKTSAVLGSAVLSSLSDLSTLYAAAALHGFNPMQVMLNAGHVWGRKNQRYLKRMGLMVDTVIGQANRFGAENLTSRDLTSRTASFVLNASGMTFTTEARRVGFAVTMMDALGALTRKAQDVSALSSMDKRILASKGIEQATWDIWRMAQLDDWKGNHTLLTPESIMAIRDPNLTEVQKRRAVAALLGLVQEEMDIAVINPSARERVALTGGGAAPGTAKGELFRSIALFKSFPWTFLSRIYERTHGAAFGTGMSANMTRYLWMGSLMAGTVVMGAIGNWISDLAQGKDPRTLNPNSEVGGKNLQTAALRGTGLSILTDFLFAETMLGTMQSGAEILAGPAFSDFSNATRVGNAWATEGKTGENKHAAARALNTLKSLTPGMNLWYTRAITDRFIWNALIEAIDPGYLDQQRRLSENRYKQSYYWAPTAGAEFYAGGQLPPERMPDMAAAVEE